jgi:hypothetical protein
MNLRGDLEVVLVKKRGVKNHKLLLTDRVAGRTKEGIEIKNRVK